MIKEMKKYELLAPHHFVREPEPKKEDFDQYCSFAYNRCRDCADIECGFEKYEEALQDHKAKYVEPEYDNFTIKVREAMAYYNYHQVLFPDFEPTGIGSSFYNSEVEIYWDDNGVHISMDNMSYWNQKGISIERFKAIIKENEV